MTGTLRSRMTKIRKKTSRILSKTKSVEGKVYKLIWYGCNHL